MKLIYIANARIPTEKAHGLQIAKMCESFAGQGLDVVLVASKVKNSIRDNTKAYYKLKHDFKVARVPCLPIGKLGRIGIIWQRFTFTLSAITYTLFAKADIIYTRHNYWAYFIFTLLGKKTGFEVHEPPRRLFWWHRFLLKRVQKKIIVAKRITDLYKKWGIKEDTYIIAPNGVDLKIFDLDLSKQQARKKLQLDFIKDDARILLYAGSLKTKGVDKGVDEILQVLKILKHDDLVFIAVGGSPGDIEYYKNMAKEFGVIDRAYFLGHQPQTTLAVYQKAADILLMPFPRKAHYEYYMTPIKMFEYMASQRPIIASDLPSIKAILNEQCSVFCQPGDARDLAEKIKLVLSDNNLAKNIAAKAFLSAQQYSWKKRVEKIIEYITSA